MSDDERAPWATQEFIRSTAPGGYRSGEWAQIIARDESTYGRPCYLVMFADGATDGWPIVNSGYGYEFSAGAPEPAA